MQFYAKNAKNNLNSTGLVERNFCFEMEETPFKTQEGGWGHPLWLCPCLATKLPWSLSSLGIFLKR